MDGEEVFVFDLKQAERIEGKFNKKFSNVERIRKATKDEAELYNENFKHSGSFLELNKEKSDELKKATDLKLGKSEEDSKE